MPHTHSHSFDLLMVPLGAAQLGGAERSIGELTIQLRAQGLRIQMLVDRVLEPTPYASDLAMHDVPVHWVDWHPQRSYFENIHEAWRIFRKFRAPIIHFNLSWRPKLWLIPLIAKLAQPKAKFVATLRSMPDPHHHVPRKKYFGFIPGLRLWMIQPKFNGWLWGKLLTRAISVNQHDFPPRMVADYYFPVQNIRVIQNGIPARKTLLTDEEKETFRQKAQISTGKIFLLYAGRLDIGKGIDDLLHALQNLPRHYQLAIVGSGFLLEELTALSEKLNLQERVQFLGFQPNPRDWMAAADIVVAPSSSPEAFGRTVIEAMAEQTAVVASIAGGMGEIFTDGQEGLYIPMRDVKALTDAIQKLGDDAKLRELVAQNGFALFQTEYSVERVRDQYLALYQEIDNQNINRRNSNEC